MNKNDCANGLWNKLDSNKNKFTAGWRHKALNTWIEKIPKKAKNKQVITLVGHNISRRFIYFNGASHPVKTSYAIKTLQSKRNQWAYRPDTLSQDSHPEKRLSSKV